ncbi:unnamed protein product [Schistocephalus solidus]|uniref:Tudor domain-containing protein n=1 Tax=Schistocephalus solidus TaxID=70667 RepID=A0A183SRV4_SCHSO|nr:unnamed protein product [Schistocephalus solidus]
MCDSNSKWHEKATVIFVTDEDIKEGQLVVCFLLHHNCYAREDAVETFFEREHLIPGGDDDGILHIPRSEFLSVVFEDQRRQPLWDKSAISLEIGEPVTVQFTSS